MPVVRFGLPAGQIGPENPLAGGSFHGKPFIAIALQAYERLEVACGGLTRKIVHFANRITLPGDTAQAGTAAIEFPEGHAHGIDTGGHDDFNDFGVFIVHSKKIAKVIGVRDDRTI
jgi:hypothetical protein